LRRVRTWIEIDKKAARHNYETFRKLLGREAELWPVVKSNAYGHGLFVFSELMQEFGADGLCVDSVLEALALRREGIRLPLLVLGPTLKNLYSEAADRKIIVSISNMEALHDLALAKKIPEFHLKFDTGMHRQGFSDKAAEAVISFLKKRKKLQAKLRGVYSHFSSADSPQDTTVCEKQLHLFLAVKEKFQAVFKNNVKYHLANTGGILLDKRYHFDIGRAGLGLYGLYPSPELARAFRSLKLLPVLSWWTRVSEVKLVAAGEGVGYDLSEKLSRRSRLAILPVGYWHGYPRALSGAGRVGIRNRLAKVAGRVSMDLVVIDATETSLRPQEAVLLLGRSGKLNIAAEELAEKCNTISYEILTRLNPLIERVIIE